MAVRDLGARIGGEEFAVFLAGGRSAQGGRGKGWRIFSWRLITISIQPSSGEEIGPDANVGYGVAAPSVRH